MQPSDAPAGAFVFDAIGGVQPLQLHLAPGSAAHTPVALVLPAMGVRASYYARFCAALNAQGVHAVAIDHPGQGDSPIRAGRRVDWGYEDWVRTHLPGIVRAVGRRFPGAPLVWVGHSLGGQVGLMHAGLHPQSIAGVVLIASGCPYFRMWPGLAGLRILLSTQLGALVAAVLGHFPGKTVGFADREARTEIRDWARCSRTGRYRFADLDGDAAIARVVQPVLAIPLVGDQLTPRAAMAHTVDKAPHAQVEWWEWRDPAGPLDHNRWPRTPDVPAQRIARWMWERWPAQTKAAASPQGETAAD